MTRITELRKAKGLQQKEVALSLGLGQSTYNQYETGKRTPDNVTLIKLANFFQVSADYLLENTNDPTPPQKEKAPISNEDLKVAFWGRPDISDKQLDKLRKFAKILEDDDNDGN